MKKNAAVITLLLLIAGMLSGCGHQHVWKEATCTEPEICTECGETEGSPLGHTWTAATCTAPKTCSVCGETEGTTLEHTWIEATCTTPKTCSVCRTTEGSASGHTWVDATCTTPKTCSVCGATEGGLAEHDLNSTGKCRLCGEQIGFALNMSNWKNYLKLTYDSVSTQASNGLWSITSYNFKLEPIANVTFGDVKATFEYYKRDRYGKSNVQTSSFNVSDTGYATGTLRNCNYANMTAVSGYIIE